jgi:hypothetical protein
MLKIIAPMILITLVACATDGEPKPTTLEAKNVTTQCPQSVIVKVKGKLIEVTAPNPFNGFVNPGLRIDQGNFIVELNTKEAGLFELTDLKAENLQVGHIPGDQFRLLLSYTPYSNTSCTNDHYRTEAQLTIENYTQSQIKGCFSGKLECDSGKVIEINAPILGTVL